MPRKPTNQHDFSEYGLGRMPPSDLRHLEKFPLRLEDVNPQAKELRPAYKMYPISIRYNQGVEGACVGMGTAGWASAYTYRNQLAPNHKYLAFNIYHEAQRIDEWPGEDYDGTSVRAGLEVGRTEGFPLDGNQQRLWVEEYRWATQVSDILDHLAFVGPVVLGMDWYSNFDRPQKHAFGDSQRQNFFIGEGDLGHVRGGHCIICMGYYRNRSGDEWVRLQNSWGWSYPLVWMPVSTVQTLWDRNALEAGCITQVKGLQPA